MVSRLTVLFTICLVGSMILAVAIPHSQVKSGIFNSNNVPPPSIEVTGFSPSVAYQGQSVTMNFTATDSDGKTALSWVDWGDGSTSDFLLNMTSNSMCPHILDPTNSTCTIAPGDLILAQSQDPSTIINGSIIAYTTSPQNPSFLVVHRVVGVVSSSQSIYDEYSFRTKGDANPSPDCWTPVCYIPASWVVAIYRYTLGPSRTAPGELYDIHTFPSLGNLPSETFEIQINATDIYGTHDYLTTTETINDRPPTASITNFTPTIATVGTSVSLTFSADDPDGTLHSVTVNWGDGTVSMLAGTATMSAHVYNSQGTFTVTLTATDNSGSTSQALTETVTINPGSEPAAPTPTILGMTPIVFYSLIAVATIVLATITAVTLRSRRNRIQNKP